MAQEQIDWNDAYANAPHIPGADAFVPRWTQKAASFRDALTRTGRAELGLPYGDTARQVFDLFQPPAQANGVLIFVHGGYWLKFDPTFWSHLAAGALEHGWSVAMPGYDLCPDVTIAEITQQIARAVSMIADQVSGPISLTGHSAGGHLVARMLAPDVLPRSVITRLHTVVPISPVADLRPLLKTEMNDSFKMDVAAAKAESPVLQPVPDRRVHVWVGGDERPVFLDQSRWLSEAWSCPQTIATGKHHFDVIDALQNPDSDLIATLIGD